MSQSAVRGPANSDLGHRDSMILVAAVLLLAFAGVGLIARAAVRGTPVDHAVLAWMIGHRQGWLSTAAVAITTAGSPVAMGLLAMLAAVVLWRRERSPRGGLVVLGTLAVATGSSTVTKLIVGAQRPPRPVQLLLEVDPSFPSGHVTGTLALSGIVAVTLGRGAPSSRRITLALVVFVVTTLVAGTRLYLGVHWLTDVIGAVFLGAASVLLGSVVLDEVRPRGSIPVESVARSIPPESYRVA